MPTSLSVMINYAQLVLYLPSIERPGHQWGEPELQQGFAWSPGIVSLSVPEHAFMCLVTLGTANDMSVDPNAISAIRVPFDIDEAPLSVGSIFHYDEVEIPPNRYALLAQTLPGAGEWEIDAEGVKERGTFDFVIDLRFVPDTTGRFEILRAGGAVGSANVLSTMTELA